MGEMVTMEMEMAIPNRKMLSDMGEMEMAIPNCKMGMMVISEEISTSSTSWD